MNKAKVLVLTLVLTMALGTCGYCQNQQHKEQTKSVTGSIAAIDWVAGKFTVRMTGVGYTDEITFMVTRDTQITRGTENIGFTDLNLSDEVAVEYYEESLAGLKAVHITVEY